MTSSKEEHEAMQDMSSESSPRTCMGKEGLLIFSRNGVDTLVGRIRLMAWICEETKYRTVGKGVNKGATGRGRSGLPIRII